MTVAVLAAVPCAVQTQSGLTELAPATMKRVGTVDHCYQSYNVEMLEVIGGRFWKPYKDIPAAATTADTSQAAAERLRE